MGEITTFEALDRPMAIAEPYIDPLHLGENFSLPFIAKDEQELVDELNDLLLAEGCIGNRYVVGANHGLYLPSSRLVALWGTR